MKTTLVTVLGADWCSDCRRSKRLLDRLGVTYDWVDLPSHPNRMDDVLKRNDGRQSIPVVIFADGTHLTEPSDAALHAKVAQLGLIPSG